MPLLRKYPAEISILVGLTVLIGMTAWLAEDAFISFRSIEQLFAGNGLVWNPGERVQVSSSPLWFAICAAARALIPNMWWAGMITSLIAGTACLYQMWVANRRETQPRELMWVIAAIVVTSTICIFDFAFSGLENPILFLLIGGVILNAKPLLLNGTLPDAKAFLKTATIAGLIPVTRHDHSMILLPLMAGWWLYGAYTKTYSWKTLIQAGVLGAAPLVLWTTISVVWFGLPLPNPAYAKLSHGIPSSELFLSGINYIVQSLSDEPVIFLIIGLGIFTLLKHCKSPWKWLILMGMVIQLAYTIKIGGDYMTGRFLGGLGWVSMISWLAMGSTWKFSTWDKLKSRPLLKIGTIVTIWVITVILLYPERIMYSRNIQWMHQHPNAWRMPTPKGMLKFETGNLVWMAFHRDSKIIWRFEGKSRLRYLIINERLFSRGTSSLVAKIISSDDHPNNIPFEKEAIRISKEWEGTPNKIMHLGVVGGVPFALGTTPIFLDPLGITDPFYARQGGFPDWRPGHITHLPNKEYLESRKYGENRMTNPRDKKMVDDFYLLTQSKDLWSSQRWAVIRRYLFDPHGGLGKPELEKGKFPGIIGLPDK